MSDLEPAQHIYHFARANEWAAAQARGDYAPAEFAQEGFIHCATAAQIAGVIQRHLRGTGPRVKLTLDPLSFGADLQYEWSNASNDLYPHLFAAIPLSKVLRAEPFDPGP